MNSDGANRAACSDSRLALVNTRGFTSTMIAETSRTFASFAEAVDLPRLAQIAAFPTITGATSFVMHLDLSVG